MPEGKSPKVVEQLHVTADASTVASVLDRWQARWPALAVLALLPEHEKAAVDVLQQTCRTRGIALMGAIFPALVTDAGFVSDGVWLVCFEHCPDHHLQAPLDDGGLQSLVEWTVQTMQGHPQRPHLFFVFDAMVPTIGTVLDELHLALHSVPYYGGVNAGSETFSPMPCLFDAERLVGNGVLVLNLGSGTAMAVRHAYPVSESLMRATAAQGNRIIQINSRPAFEVYQEVILREYGVALTRENFYDYAVHFPFGVVTMIDVLVRIPVALDDDQSLVCVGEIPPHASLRLLRAPQLAESDCVAQLLDGLHGLGVAQPAGLMTFYCAGRRMHFGAEAAAELLELHQRSGAAHLYGALSLGEIDSIDDLGVPRFHNAALVCVAPR